MEWPHSETRIRSSYASPGPTAPCWLLQHFVKHVDQRFIIFNLFQTKRQIQQNVTGKTSDNTWSSQNLGNWWRGTLRRTCAVQLKWTLVMLLSSRGTFLDSSVKWSTLKLWSKESCAGSLCDRAASEPMSFLVLPQRAKWNFPSSLPPSLHSLRQQIFV